MRGIERLKTVERTTEALAKALPALPVPETVMIRLIQILVYGLEDYFLHVFRDLGLTEKSYHTLCILVASKKRQAYPGELSELVGTSKANMTKILATLEAKGYINREIGKTDGRRSLIKITPRGLKEATKITPLISGPVGDAFSGLNTDEISVLDELLKKLIVSFDTAKHNADSIF
ncbi:MAG: MarR family transcriptional regulator [Cellvibrionaceae bacterium]